jgi:hypothetical protein
MSKNARIRSVNFHDENLDSSKIDVGGTLTLPSIRGHDPEPALKAEAVDCIIRINQIQQYVVEKNLKRGNRRSELRKKTAESVRAYDTERQNLSVKLAGHQWLLQFLEFRSSTEVELRVVHLMWRSGTYPSTTTI